MPITHRRHSPDGRGGSNPFTGRGLPANSPYRDHGNPNSTNRLTLGPEMAKKALLLVLSFAVFFYIVSSGVEDDYTPGTKNGYKGKDNGKETLHDKLKKRREEEGIGNPTKLVLPGDGSNNDSSLARGGLDGIGGDQGVDSMALGGGSALEGDLRVGGSRFGGSQDLEGRNPNFGMGGGAGGLAEDDGSNSRDRFGGGAGGFGDNNDGGSNDPNSFESRAKDELARQRVFGNDASGDRLSNDGGPPPSRDRNSGDQFSGGSLRGQGSLGGEDSGDLSNPFGASRGEIRSGGSGMGLGGDSLRFGDDASGDNERNKAIAAMDSMQSASVDRRDSDALSNDGIGYKKRPASEISGDLGNKEDSRNNERSGFAASYQDNDGEEGNKSLDIDANLSNDRRDSVNVDTYRKSGGMSMEKALEEMNSMKRTMGGDANTDRDSGAFDKSSQRRSGDVNSNSQDLSILQHQDQLAIPRGVNPDELAQQSQKSMDLDNSPDGVESAYRKDEDASKDAKEHGGDSGDSYKKKYAVDSGDSYQKKSAVKSMDRSGDSFMKHQDQMAIPRGDDPGSKTNRSAGEESQAMRDRQSALSTDMDQSPDSKADLGKSNDSIESTYKKRFDAVEETNKSGDTANESRAKRYSSDKKSDVDALYKKTFSSDREPSTYKKRSGRDASARGSGDKKSQDGDNVRKYFDKKGSIDGEEVDSHKIGASGDSYKKKYSHDREPTDYKTNRYSDSKTMTMDVSGESYKKKYSSDRKSSTYEKKYSGTKIDDSGDSYKKKYSSDRESSMYEKKYSDTPAKKSDDANSDNSKVREYFKNPSDKKPVASGDGSDGSYKKKKRYSSAEEKTYSNIDTYKKRSSDIEESAKKSNDADADKDRYSGSREKYSSYKKSLEEMGESYVKKGAATGDSSDTKNKMESNDKASTDKKHVDSHDLIDSSDLNAKEKISSYKKNFDEVGASIKKSDATNQSGDGAKKQLGSGDNNGSSDLNKVSSEVKDSDDTKMNLGSNDHVSSDRKRAASGDVSELKDLSYKKKIDELQEFIKKSDDTPQKSGDSEKIAASGDKASADSKIVDVGSGDAKKTFDNSADNTDPIDAKQNRSGMKASTDADASPDAKKSNDEGATGSEDSIKKEEGSADKNDSSDHTKLKKSVEEAKGSGDAVKGSDDIKTKSGEPKDSSDAAQKDSGDIKKSADRDKDSADIKKDTERANVSADEAKKSRDLDEKKDDSVAEEQQAKSGDTKSADKEGESDNKKSVKKGDAMKYSADTAGSNDRRKGSKAEASEKKGSSDEKDDAAEISHDVKKAGSHDVASKKASGDQEDVDTREPESEKKSDESGTEKKSGLFGKLRGKKAKESDADIGSSSVKEGESDKEKSTKDGDAMKNSADEAGSGDKKDIESESKEKGSSDQKDEASKDAKKIGSNDVASKKASGDQDDADAKKSESAKKTGLFGKLRGTRTKDSDADADKEGDSEKKDDVEEEKESAKKDSTAEAEQSEKESEVDQSKSGKKKGLLGKLHLKKEKKEDTEDAGGDGTNDTVAKKDDDKSDSAGGSKENASKDGDVKEGDTDSKKYAKSKKFDPAEGEVLESEK